MVPTELHNVCGQGGRTKSGARWVGGEYKPAYVLCKVCLAKTRRTHWPTVNQPTHMKLFVEPKQIVCCSCPPARTHAQQADQEMDDEWLTSGHCVVSVHPCRYVWALLLLACAVRRSFHARFRKLCEAHGGRYVEAPVKSAQRVFENDMGCVRACVCTSVRACVCT